MAADFKAAKARRYGGVSAAKRKAERREKLLAAGLEVFGTAGFHAATVKQVCAEAGLTERYFYESFRNQAQLFDTLYDQVLADVHQRITAAIAATPAAPEAMAEAGLRAFYGSLKQDPRLARILVIEVYVTTQDTERMYRRGVEGFAELIRRLIETFYPGSGSQGLSSSLMATALVGAAVHLAMRWYLEDFADSTETLVTNHLAIITAVAERLGGAATSA